MKTRRLLLLLILVLAVSTGCTRDEAKTETARWGEFVPIVWSEEEDDLVTRPEMLTRDFGATLAEFLVDYGERFRYEPGERYDRVYVSSELAANDELVWNFTTKAMERYRKRKEQRRTDNE